MTYPPDEIDIGIHIDIGPTPWPARQRKNERGKRAPWPPGFEPCTEPEYLDLPVPLRDPGTPDPRIHVWC